MERDFLRNTGTLLSVDHLFRETMDEPMASLFSDYIKSIKLSSTAVSLMRSLMAWSNKEYPNAIQQVSLLEIAVQYCLKQFSSASLTVEEVNDASETQLGVDVGLSFLTCELLKERAVEAKHAGSLGVLKEELANQSRLNKMGEQSEDVPMLRANPNLPPLKVPRTANGKTSRVQSSNKPATGDSKKTAELPKSARSSAKSTRAGSQREGRPSQSDVPLPKQVADSPATRASSLTYRAGPPDHGPIGLPGATPPPPSAAPVVPASPNSKDPPKTPEAASSPQVVTSAPQSSADAKVQQSNVSKRINRSEPRLTKFETVQKTNACAFTVDFSSLPSWMNASKDDQTGKATTAASTTADEQAATKADLSGSDVAEKADSGAQSDLDSQSDTPSTRESQSERTEPVVAAQSSAHTSPSHSPQHRTQMPTLKRLETRKQVKTLALSGRTDVQLRRIATAEASQLKRILFGDETTRFSNEWRSQPLQFIDETHSTSPTKRAKGPLPDGVAQFRLRRCANAPYVVVSILQAHIMRQILFSDADGARAKTGAKSEQEPLARRRCDALVNALSDLLTLVSRGGRLTLAYSSCAADDDRLVESLELLECSSHEALRAAIEQNVAQFDSPHAAANVLCSVLLTTGLPALERTLRLQNANSRSNGRHVSSFSHGRTLLLATAKDAQVGTFELATLLVSGTPCFRNEPDVGCDDQVAQRTRCTIGLLDAAELTREDCDELSAHFRTPVYPIWLLHFTDFDQLAAPTAFPPFALGGCTTGVCYSVSRTILSDWKSERRFSLRFCFGLSRNEELSLEKYCETTRVQPSRKADDDETEVIESCPWRVFCTTVTVDCTNRQFKFRLSKRNKRDQERLVNMDPIELCLRTKWKDSELTFGSEAT